jgi:predicted dehydrogenase
VLRIGFVGAGVIAWAHSLGLKAMIKAGLVDATVSGVHDPDESRASRFAEANHTDACTSLAALLERSDAVWVCTPTAGHRAVVETAVGEGRAVFCEKPLAPDLSTATALAEVVARSGVPAQVGLVLRSTPVFRAMRQAVASGELGRPMAAVFRDDQYFPNQGLYSSTWRSDVAAAGGGCLIEHSIHDLDILRHCLGEVAGVSGRTANFSGFRGIEDVATLSLRFESGASADLVSVWHGILSRGSTRRVELFCERGMVWLDDDFRGPLHVQTSDGTEVRPCPSPEWVDDLPLRDDDIGLAIRMYVEADRAFVDAVSAGRRPEPGFDEAVMAHRLVDAAYRSAAAGGAPIPLG